MYQYPYGNAQQLNLDWILSKIQELEAGSASGSDLEEVANVLAAASFDATVPYRRYDYAFYDGKLYRALNDNLGAFNPSDWLEVTLGADISVLTRLVNADDAAITTLQNRLDTLGSDDVANESTVTGTTVSDALGNLNGAITSIPASRIRGKQIAIYGDSWAASYHGSLGADYISSYTGVTVHVSADPGGTMARVKTNAWDSYNADIYIICAGLNDLGANTTLTTYKNGIAAWLNAIRGVNSNAEIYFITPPMMRTNTIHTCLYPLEAYRTMIWRYAPVANFNVINSLKWTDVALESDNTHPVLADAPKIGKHIVDAIINYGDGESHITDYSSLHGVEGDAGNFRIMFDGGNAFISLAGFQKPEDTSGGNNATIAIPDSAGTDFAAFVICVMSGAVQPIYFFHGYQNANFKLYRASGAGTGDFYISGAYIPVPIVPYRFD